MAPDAAVAARVEDLLVPQPSALLPRARVAVHAGWFHNLGKDVTPSSRVTGLLPGFCHSLVFDSRRQSVFGAYFDYCAKTFPEHYSNQSTHGFPVERLLFDFENVAASESGRDWTWATGCRRSQAFHYEAMASAVEAPRFVEKAVEAAMPLSLLPTTRVLADFERAGHRALRATMKKGCGALPQAETGIAGCAGPDLDPGAMELRCEGRNPEGQ